MVGLALRCQPPIANRRVRVHHDGAHEVPHPTNSNGVEIIQPSVGAPAPTLGDESQIEINLEKVEA